MINISDEISKRASSCNIMNDYICGRECPMSSKHDKIHEIDSIIRVNLQKNNIELDYNPIGDSLFDSRKHRLFSSKCYRQHVQGFTEKDGIKLYMRLLLETIFAGADEGMVYCFAFIYPFRCRFIRGNFADVPARKGNGTPYSRFHQQHGA